MIGNSSRNKNKTLLIIIIKQTTKKQFSPKSIESDEENTCVNFLQDRYHKDELQECAGFSKDSDLNRVSDKFLGGWSYQFNCFDKIQYE